MASITQIKRDLEQACELNEINNKHLEEKYENAIKESKEAPESIIQSIKEVQEVAASNEKSIKHQQDRTSYLRRVILSNRNDCNIFLEEMAKIHEKSLELKEEHQKNLEKQKSEQQEMENELGTQIQSAVHQLKGLRFLQELRHQLDQQTRAVKQLIEEEKQLNSDDLTDIRRQIFEQRKFYEDDLNTRLEIARKFAEEFSDLHMELATTKIINETVSNRKQLQEESLKTIQLLRENDLLRKKHHILDQQFKINQTSVENLHSDYSTLKISLNEFSEKMDNSLNNSKIRIRDLKDEKDDIIGELKLRKEDGIQRRDKLNQELLAAKRELLRVETARSESSQKEYEVLDKMSQTATFILTAIDKSMDTESISNESVSDKIQNKSPRNLKINKKQSDAQKSELSRLMLRLQNISQKMKDDAMKTQSAQWHSDAEKADVETQTDISVRSELLTGKIQPPSILERAQNPRRKPSVQTFHKAPPVYKRLYEKSKVPVSVRQTSFARPTHA